VIDSDFRGTSPSSLDSAYEKRTYTCRHCKWTGIGHLLQEQSPPELFLQPHPMYPMKSEEFERWLAVLRENFPDDPMVANVSTSLHPGKPHLFLHWLRKRLANLFGTGRTS
jgi:hypothetical protein